MAWHTFCFVSNILFALLLEQSYYRMDRVASFSNVCSSTHPARSSHVLRFSVICSSEFVGARIWGWHWCVFRPAENTISIQNMWQTFYACSHLRQPCFGIICTMIFCSITTSSSYIAGIWIQKYKHFLTLYNKCFENTTFIWLTTAVRRLKKLLQ